MGNAITINEKDSLIGYQLLETYNLYVKLLTQRTHSGLMQLNLTQWRTLTYIRFNPKLTQRALALNVGIDPSSMTPVIDFFERKGWVERVRSPTNRSAYNISLTAKGSKAYAIIEREIQKAEDLFAGILSEKGHSQLCDLLATLNEGIEKAI